jgi:transposase-like protein/IS1 family transposase
MEKRNASGTRKRDTSRECCLNDACPSRGKIGQGNIVIHDSSRGRFKCNVCKKTFNKKRGTALEGIRKPEELFVTVISLLSWGCPTQAIVHTYKLDERTVAEWQVRAGLHCEKVHQDQIEQGKLDPKQAQADEMRIKARGVILWMAMAMAVPTRLWVAGAVSKTRDSKLIDRLMLQVRKCCKSLCSLLICTDGFAAYPKSIMRAFREKVKKTPGRGRCCLEIWPELQIGTVIKRTVNRRLKEVIRQVTYGTEEMAQKLLGLSRGGSMLNTSYIERLNATFRERLASLTRKCRHAVSKEATLHAGMYLIGSTYNFCIVHQELSKALDLGGWGFPCTPAMASGITDHVWSVKELLTYKVIPPPLPIPKKKGRPRTKHIQNTSVPKKPVVRMRKGGLCASTT